MLINGIGNFLVIFVFSTEITDDSIPPTYRVDLEPNVIYGVSQNYLAKVCINGGSPPFTYDRRYDSVNDLNNGSDAYTIVHTSGILLGLNKICIFVV